MSVSERAKRNVKVFVLYLMDHVRYPLDFGTINDIVRQSDYVVYLDFAEVFPELVEKGLIEKVTVDGEEKYAVTPNGQTVADTLAPELPRTMRDKGLSAALQFLDFKKRDVRLACEVKLIPGTKKATVTATITEAGTLIFSQTLVADSVDHAEGMRRTFLERPEVIYRGSLALMAGNMHYLFN